MSLICLLHWNEGEAAERLERLRAAGFDAYHSVLAGPPLFRQLRANPPAAIAIDLGRLPSHGREVGAALRATKATRYIPLVFVGGEAEKVDRVRALLPDRTPPGTTGAARAAHLPPPGGALSMDAYAGRLCPEAGIKG
jgi:CheY-like chemotaxis protein